MRKALLAGILATTALTAGPARAAVESALSVSPSPVAVGSILTVALTVTNTGGFDETGVSATIQMDAGESLVTLLAGPVPPDPLTITAGEATVFIWTYSVTGAGTLSWTATATAVVPASASGSALAAFPAALAAAASISRDPAPVGGWIEAVLTVTNTGGVALLDAGPSIAVTAGGVLIEAVAGPSPSSVASIPPGAAASFTWTLSASGTGTIALSLSATGQDAWFATNVGAVAPPVGATLAMPAALSVSVTPFAYTTVVGASLAILVTVTNTGGFPATNVTPVLDVNQGNVSPLGPPNPASADLPPGSSTRFLFGLSANGAGAVMVTVTVAGTDTGLGGTVGTAGSASATVLTPASIALSLAAGPSPIIAGGILSVTLWAQNTGEAGADLAPVLAPAFGTALVVELSAPGSRVIDGLNLVPFLWTFSITGCGDVGFTATLAGNQLPVFAPVSAWAASASVLLKGDPFDPADDAATAGSWLAPGPAWTAHGPHVLCAADAADWYRLALERGAAYRIETTGVGDAFAELSDDAAGSVVVASDDDGAGSLQSRVDLTAERAGTFWLKVRTVPAGSDWAGAVRTRRLLAASLSLSPPTAATGQLVTIVLTVTNTAGANLTGATPTLAAVPGLALGGPPAPATVPSGGMATFTWTATVTGPGSPALTATVTGLDAGTGRTLTAFATAAPVTVRPAALAAAVAVSPDPVTTGQWLSIRLTVTNTGDDTANGVAPVLGFTQGGGLVAPVTAPAGPVALGAGAAATFTWTYSASGAGGVAFTVTVAGTGALAGNPVQAVAVGTASIAARASLIGSLLISAGNVEIGAVARVVLSVTNTGGTAVTGVMPMIEAVAGGGLATDLSGPVPAGPVTIGPLGRASFTWTYSITGAGVIALSATAAGSDAATGSSALATGGVLLVTATPPSVSAAVAISPAVPVVGQVLTVTLSATNTGGVAATGVVPALSVNRGAGSLAALSGPLPAGPVGLNAGGGAQTFTWTFSVTGAGALEFTGTASGQDAWTGAAVRAAATAGTTPRAPASLTATLGLSPSSYWGFLAGGTLTAVLTVMNGGDVDAVGVVPVASPYAGGSLLGPATGPSPAGPVTIAAHGQASFTWTWTISGAGAIGISATATGADAVTAAPLSATATASASVLGRGALSVQLSAATTAREGESFDVTLTLANSGSEYVQADLPSLAASEPGRVGIAAPRPLGPGGLPGYLAPGAVTRVRWSVKALRAGDVTLVVSASGRRISDNSTVTATASAPLAVQEAFDAAHPLVAWPNPVSGDVLTVAVRIPQAAARLVVEVYSASFLKIADGEWRYVAPGADAQVRLTGVRGWATGVYLVRAKAWYVDGTQETFAPVKVAVKR